MLFSSICDINKQIGLKNESENLIQTEEITDEKTNTCTVIWNIDLYNAWVYKH